VGNKCQRRGAKGDFSKINKDLRVLTESDITWQEEITGKTRERPNAYSQFFHRLELALREKNPPKCETGAEALKCVSAPALNQPK
jgi:hypothetical protein